VKCVFCAEEIKDEAQLCRFCGAWLADGKWQSPAAPAFAAKQRRSFTMVSTGWLLILSGAWMLVCCTTPVPLFGAMRGGAVAVLYNGALGIVLLAMGYALAGRKPWALAATMAATAGYTLDKLLFIFDASARRASLVDGSQLIKSLGPGIDSMVDQVALVMAVSFLAGWWGLVIYIWLKRSYFQQATSFKP